jgi:hypothetical protein
MKGGRGMGNAWVRFLSPSPYSILLFLASFSAIATLEIITKTNPVRYTRGLDLRLHLYQLPLPSPSSKLTLLPILISPPKRGNKWYRIVLDYTVVQISDYFSEGGAICRMAIDTTSERIKDERRRRYRDFSLSHNIHAIYICCVSWYKHETQPPSPSDRGLLLMQTEVMRSVVERKPSLHVKTSMHADYEVTSS